MGACLRWLSRIRGQGMSRSLPTKCQQMPAELADHRSWQRVERADEDRIEQPAFPAGVQPRFHRKTLGNNAQAAEARRELDELAHTQLEQDRSVLVFEAD